MRTHCGELRDKDLARATWDSKSAPASLSWTDMSLSTFNWQTKEAQDAKYSYLETQVNMAEMI